jgi:replication-associated recombination protein RarA
MHEENATCLRGLVWLTSILHATSGDDGSHARAGRRRRPLGVSQGTGVGPRAIKVGNAAVYALSEMGSPEAVGHLAMLKVRVKFGSAQKEIEKAFDTAAEALSLPRDQIEEMAVPSYGLEAVGLRRETFADGEYTAELRVDGVTSTFTGAALTERRRNPFRPG